MSYKIKLSILLASLLSVMFFSGCGGSGGTSYQIGETNIKSCADGWSDVESGYTVDAQADAILEFQQDEDDNKQVCIKSGSAFIVAE